MKLAYHLAQYLYTNKRLDLPGIGTFQLDPTVIIEAENSKQRTSSPEGISFKSNSSLQDAADLIHYISTKCGKMKALAIADLESHLELAHQFLNIGKPFLFEGIGSLVKIRQGEFEFTPGTILTEKIKDSAEKEVHGLSKKETVDAKYQAYLSTPVAKTPWKKPVMVLLILCGIGLAVWGGYTIATKNSANDDTLSESVDPQTVPYTDSSSLKTDSSAIAKANIPNNYKYVLGIRKGNRAFTRFNQLKENNWDIKMETSDSFHYKLFITLPVTSDTTRKLDSLMNLCGHKVYIEY